MKKALSILVATILSSSAFASDFAAVAGFRSNSADAASTGVTMNSKSGLGAGVLGFFDLVGDLQGRMGFLYNQRNVGGKTAASEFDLNLAYMDIPVTAMYKFADYAGMFAGPVVSLLASKEYKSNVSGGEPANSPEGMNVGLQFGASFKFAPQLGAELYYETFPSTIWKDAVKNVRTVGVNLLFTFE